MGSSNVARQASFSNTGANVTAANNSPYSAHMQHQQPTSAAAILQSGSMREHSSHAASAAAANNNNGNNLAQQIFSSAHGSIHNELSAHRQHTTHPNLQSSGFSHLASGDGGRYDGMIPLVSKFTFVMIWFGIVVSFVAIIATILLTVKYINKDTNDSDEKSNTTLIRNVRCVIVPLTAYVCNAVICLLFYMESRRLQIHGYSDLYLKTSEICKINFRVCSAYFTVAFATYAFLSNVCVFFF